MNNNNTQALLFPPLVDTPTQESKEEKEGDLLWHNVNTFSIPDEPILHTTTTTTTGLAKELFRRPHPHYVSHEQPSHAKEDGSVFNISWGGDDKPPMELHPDPQQEEIKLTRPLPKPRGIRKLPEPEPSEDGTIDEDTLKRRKNTDAARRSRLKKFMKVDQLENQVSALQAENAKLVLSNAVLESEKKSLYAKEIEYKKRIKYLEDIMICQGWDFDKNYHVGSDQW